MNLLVFDDDPAVLRCLEAMGPAVFGTDRISFTTVASVEAVLVRLGSASCDALLLDPTRDDGCALELLTARNASLLPVIVVTADRSLAVPAFDSGVLDFVLKPVVPNRLELALRRLDHSRHSREPASRLLAARRCGRIDLVPIEDLVYVEGADKYSELVRADGRRVLHDKGLSRLEEALPASFVRIHKSFLVRLALVSRLRVLRGSRYFAELTTGERLPVGRSHYGKLKARMM